MISEVLLALCGCCETPNLGVATLATEVKHWQGLQGPQDHMLCWHVGQQVLRQVHWQPAAEPVASHYLSSLCQSSRY
jgi:hypothetical protein